MTPFAFGLRTPDPVRYVAAVLRASRDWPLKGDTMHRPQGPEVGNVLRADALPCGCTFDNGTWFPCPDHPSSCQAIVLWTDERRIMPAQRCGVPVAAGFMLCADHQKTHLTDRVPFPAPVHRQDGHHVIGLCGRGPQQADNAYDWCGAYLTDKTELVTCRECLALICHDCDRAMGEPTETGLCEDCGHAAALNRAALSQN